MGIYLFKVSEQLLQAEIQPNHNEVCALTPPTLFCAYFITIIIQVEVSRQLGQIGKSSGDCDQNLQGQVSDQY